MKTTLFPVRPTSILLSSFLVTQHFRSSNPAENTNDCSALGANEEERVLHVLQPLSCCWSLSILQVINFATSGRFSQILLILGQEPRDTWSVTSVWLAKATRYKPHKKQLILRSRLKSIAIVSFLLHPSLLSTWKVLCSLFTPDIANTGLIAEVIICLALLMYSKRGFYNPLK